MNTQVKDKMCSCCGYEEIRFLHPVWYEERIQSFCTSCVLLSHKQSFCPTCFGFHDFNSEGFFIRCSKCLSLSHPPCFSSNSSTSSTPPKMCSSCLNPNKLRSALNKIKALGDDGNMKEMDKNLADLLLTAAKIATLSISKATELSKNFAEILATKTVLAKKKAIAAINHVVEYVDRENKRHNGGEGNEDDGPSLLDFTSDEDNCTETEERIAAEDADYDIETP